MNEGTEARERYLQFWENVSSERPVVPICQVDVTAGKGCESVVHETEETMGLWRPSESEGSEGTKKWLSEDFVPASSLPRARRFFTGSVLWALWGGSEPGLAHVLQDLPAFMQKPEEARDQWADKLGVRSKPPPSDLDCLVMGWGRHKERTIRATVLRCLRGRL